MAHVSVWRPRDPPTTLTQVVNDMEALGRSAESFQRSSVLRVG